MELLCETCNKLKQYTNFNFLEESLKLDVSKCQECINPKMYDKIREYVKDFINN